MSLMTNDDIRKVRLAREAVREGRPKTEAEKIGIEDPKDFAAFKIKFNTVCNVDGLSDEERLKELGEWTKGAAKRMVESNYNFPDPTKALAAAWKQLAVMFRAVVTTPLQRLEPVFKKGQLQENSIPSHFDTLADIRVVYNEACRSSASREFDRIDVIRETIDRKMAVYRVKFWEEQAREKKEDPAHKTRFLDIIDFIAERAETASMMGSLTNQPSKGQKTININATESTQENHQPAPIRNDQQGQTSQNQKPKCSGCSLSNHKTKDCNKLKRMDPEKLNEWAKELFICYRCGEPGHSARSCKEPKPVCKECGNNHLTIFHAYLLKRYLEKKAQKNQQNSQNNQRAQNNQTTQNNQNSQNSYNNRDTRKEGGQGEEIGRSAQAHVASTETEKVVATAQEPQSSQDAASHEKQL